MSAFSSLSEFWQTMLPFIMLVEIVLEIGLFMYQLLRSNKPVRSLLSLAVALFGRGGVFQMVLHAIDVLRSNVAGSAFRRNIQLTQRLQKILGRYAKFCRKVFHLGLVFSHALISLTLPPACAEPPEFFPAGRFRAYIPAASGLGLALIDQKFPPLRGQNVAHELLFGHAPSAYGAHPGGHMPPVHAIRLPRPPFRRPCPHRHRPCQPIRPLRERGS